MNPLPDSASETVSGTETSVLEELAKGVRDAPPSSRRLAPADFMDRVGAAMLDGAIQVFLCLFVAILTGVVAAVLGFGARLALDSVFGPGILLATLLLYSLTEVIGSASPGKWFPQICVARPDGRPAPVALRFRRCIVRNAHLLLFLGGYVLWVFEMFATMGMRSDVQFIQTIQVVFQSAAFLAGAAVALGTLGALLPHGRTLHDYLSGTAVYRARDVGALAAEAERGFEPVIQTPSGLDRA